MALDDAHARISSIFRTREERGISAPDPGQTDFEFAVQRLEQARVSVVYVLQE